MFITPSVTPYTARGRQLLRFTRARHGLISTHSTRVPSPMRTATIPIGPTVGNIVFAIDAPICTEAMAASTKAMGSRVEIRLGCSVMVCEVFRSTRLPECNERAFMLYAVGIASAIARDGSEYILLVDIADAVSAGEPLQFYEREPLYKPPPPPPPPKLHPHAL